MGKLYVKQIRVDNDHLYVTTESGKVAVYNLRKIKGFRHATTEQLQHFVVMGGIDLYWPDLDEDINLEGMLYDNRMAPLTATEDSVIFRPIPESRGTVGEPLH